MRNIEINSYPYGIKKENDVFKVKVLLYDLFKITYKNKDLHHLIKFCEINSEMLTFIEEEEK